MVQPFVAYVEGKEIHQSEVHCGLFRTVVVALVCGGSLRPIQAKGAGSIRSVSGVPLVRIRDQQCS
jgi:hypothetical protein